MDNKLRLIWTLGKQIKDSLTIRQLSKESGIPYATAYRVVNKNSIFNIVRKGNIKLCSLNLDDPITKNYLIVSERQESEIFRKKHPKLNIIANELPKGNYTVILFGSRAEGKHREKSDVDICIINEDANKDVKFSKYEQLFKLEINAIYLKREEFKKMLKEKEHNITHEIVNNHIILYGEEYFWNTIF
ncbi:MAG: nucleotidyltransferase domain-containing protein [Nanoarchaeota archaeon]|nr:nucleotidyltransferase domain-containing protein [Nanoarchaeota archaeon]